MSIVVIFRRYVRSNRITESSIPEIFASDKIFSIANDGISKLNNIKIFRSHLVDFLIVAGYWLLQQFYHTVNDMNNFIDIFVKFQETFVC